MAVVSPTAAHSVRECDTRYLEVTRCHFRYYGDLLAMADVHCAVPPRFCSVVFQCGIAKAVCSAVHISGICSDMLFALDPVLRGCASVSRQGKQDERALALLSIHDTVVRRCEAHRGRQGGSRSASQCIAASTELRRRPVELGPARRAPPSLSQFVLGRRCGWWEDGAAERMMCFRGEVELERARPARRKLFQTIRMECRRQAAGSRQEAVRMS